VFIIIGTIFGIAAIVVGVLFGIGLINFSVTGCTVPYLEGTTSNPDFEKYILNGDHVTFYCKDGYFNLKSNTTKCIDGMLDVSQISCKKPSYYKYHALNIGTENSYIAAQKICEKTYELGSLANHGYETKEQRKKTFQNISTVIGVFMLGYKRNNDLSFIRPDGSPVTNDLEGWWTDHPLKNANFVGAYRNPPHKESNTLFSEQDFKKTEWVVCEEPVF